MDMSLDHAVLKLPRHRTLELRDAAGARLTSLAGSLWITQDQDVRDIVLEPGENFELDQAGLTLVHAMDDACLRIDQPLRRENGLFDRIWRYWQSQRVKGLGRDPLAGMPATMLR